MAFGAIFPRLPCQKHTIQEATTQIFNINILQLPAQPLQQMSDGFQVQILMSK